MPSYGSTSAALIVVIGLAGTWVKTQAPHTPRTGPALPLAALAWAQANCDSTLSARPDTPRVQAEDLFRVAAIYDADRVSHGLKYACRQAILNSDSVASAAQHSPVDGILSVFASLR